MIERRTGAALCTPVFSFPRSPWECRPGRSAALGFVSLGRRSVEDGIDEPRSGGDRIPTLSVGTRNRSDPLVGFIDRRTGAALCTPVLMLRRPRPLRVDGEGSPG
jgi:hypothetical protein